MQFNDVLRWRGIMGVDVFSVKQVNNFLPLCLLEVIVKGEEIKRTITLNKSTGFSGFKCTTQLYNKGPVISRQFNVEMLHLRTFKLKYLKGSENCFYQHLKISNFCV